MLSLTAVIVLAAGLSRRFGAADKLMADVDGRPMVAHVLETVRSLDMGQRIVVTRPDSAVPHLAQDFDIVVNPEPESGMGTSIATGVGAVRPDMEAALIVLGDMPYIAPPTYTALAGYAADIIVPVYDGQPGHPVLFRRRCFDELAHLSGDVGAKALIGGGRYTLSRVPIEGRAGLIDLDTPDDLQKNAFRRL